MNRNTRTLIVLVVAVVVAALATFGVYHTLQTMPVRGSLGASIPTDPTMYRFYEMVQVYGSTLKALVHEKFGDGIISAINFRMNIEKVEDPDGGHRAVITLDGKYLPTKPW